MNCLLLLECVDVLEVCPQFCLYAPSLRQHGFWLLVQRCLVVYGGCLLVVAVCMLSSFNMPNCWLCS